MSGFEPLINQERPIRILTTLLQNGTLPHALLFTGTEGVGKQAAATALAMALNCQAQNSGRGTDQSSMDDPPGPFGKSDFAAIESCGVCKSCKKIASGSHPDIIRIQPSGPFIRIDQIRALVLTLTMKPYESDTRVTIISDAQAMNASASNALLKILEEPPRETMLILIATQKSDLLPTIVSRCQHVGFNPISTSRMLDLLKEKYGLEPEAAAVLAAMANGSLSRAQAMVKDNWLRRRKWLLGEMDALSSQPLSRLFGLAEKISRDKQMLPDALQIIKVWFRDLVISQYVPAKIINQDARDKIASASQQVDISALLSKIDAVQEIQNRFTASTNLRLAIENLLIRLAQP